MTDIVESLCQEARNGNLFDLGPDKTVINQQDSQGQTPLFCASSHGHSQIVFDLLQAGADANVTCEPNETTALHAAASGGHVEVLALLLAAGANINARNSSLLTAKQEAIGNTKEVFEEFEQRGIAGLSHFPGVSNLRRPDSNEASPASSLSRKRQGSVRADRTTGIITQMLTDLNISVEEGIATPTLIMKLIESNNPDFNSYLFCSYRKMVTPQVLFETIFNYSKMAVFESKCVQVLRFWITNHWDDFQENKSAFTRILAGSKQTHLIDLINIQDNKFSFPSLPSAPLPTIPSPRITIGKVKTMEEMSGFKMDLDTLTLSPAKAQSQSISPPKMDLDSLDGGGFFDDCFAVPEEPMTTAAKLPKMDLDAIDNAGMDEFVVRKGKSISSKFKPRQHRMVKSPAKSETVFDPEGLQSSITLSRFYANDPKFIAEQITIYQQSLWEQISRADILNYKPPEKANEIRPGNPVDNFIMSFNTLSNWAQISILKAVIHADRIETAHRLIQVCDVLLHHRNFNAVFAIFSAFQSASVYRLTATLKGVRNTTTFKALEAATTPSENFKNYRSNLFDDAKYSSGDRSSSTSESDSRRSSRDHANPDEIGPTIPHLGILLTDLVHYSDGMPSKKGENWNLLKFLTMGKAIYDVFQTTKPYKFQADSKAQEFWSNLTLVSDDDLYFQTSLWLEPRSLERRPTPTTLIEAEIRFYTPEQLVPPVRENSEKVKKHKKDPHQSKDVREAFDSSLFGVGVSDKTLKRKGSKQTNKTRSKKNLLDKQNSREDLLSETVGSLSEKEGASTTENVTAKDLAELQGRLETQAVQIDILMKEYLKQSVQISTLTQQVEALTRALENKP